MIIRNGIGQDSHRFLAESGNKTCIIAGIPFENVPGFDANSDGDVVFHAITNAISSVTGVTILGGIADRLCLDENITDSLVYLQEAMKTLRGQKISHVAVSLEGKRPKFKEHVTAMRQSVADAMGLDISQVGITATTGEALTAFGRGEGIQCLALITTVEG